MHHLEIFNKTTRLADRAHIFTNYRQLSNHVTKICQWETREPREYKRYALGADSVWGEHSERHRHKETKVRYRMSNKSCPVFIICWLRKKNMISWHTKNKEKAVSLINAGKIFLWTLGTPLKTILMDFLIYLTPPLSLR